MIPLKLEISNFMSYRAPVLLDFHGIHLACISGPNGAGKSSILDAITWALFGRSRSKGDDNVINRAAVLNGEAAHVKFSYELEGITYRIIRQKEANKATTLDFQVADQSGSWKSLNEGGIRQTNAAIESLLSMSYDTFINASFLLQGKADEFTIKTPNKRKEVLADLLGVSRWDQYRDAVVAERKQAETQQSLFDAQLSEIANELGERSEREADLNRAEERHLELKRLVASQEALLKQIRVAQAAADQQSIVVTTLKKQLEEAEGRLEQLQAHLSQQQTRRMAYLQLLDSEDEITSNYANWQEAATALEQWQDKANAYYQLLEQMKPHELLVERKASELRERLNTLQVRQREINIMADSMESVASTIDESLTEMDKISSTLVELAEVDDQYQESVARLKQFEAEAEFQKQELERLEKRESQIIEAKRKLEQSQSLIATLQKDRARSADAFNSLKRSRDHLLSLKSEYVTLQAQQVQLRSEMVDIKERLESLRGEIGGRCPLCGQPLDAKHKAEVLADLQRGGTEKGDQHRANQKLLKSLDDRIGAAEQDIEAGERAEAELRKLDQQVARSEATIAQAETIVAEWHEDDAARLDALRGKVAGEQELAIYQQAVEKFKAQLEEKRRLEERRMALLQQKQKAEERLKEVDEAVTRWQRDDRASLKELEAISNRLEKNNILPEVQESITALKSEAAKIGYDPTAHENTRIAESERRAYRLKFDQLNQARAAAAPLDDVVADLEKQLAAQESSLIDLNAQLAGAQARLVEMTDGLLDARSAEAEVNRLRDEQIEAFRLYTLARQKVAVLDALAIRKEEIGIELNDTRRLIQQLKLLEKACGKEGVQALLIEHALPEIEEKANELLARLTGGGMRIYLETQRQLKTADRLKETLDIRISDSAGERPYENYSGGEQFRVNFALRLALSDILTRRAGVRLQTLIIDEGFGSQDPEGRQRLIEAINTIQNDFEKILVITHIDELRDAFPTRIEVSKDRMGSRIEVV